MSLLGPLLGLRDVTLHVHLKASHNPLIILYVYVNRLYRIILSKLLIILSRWYAAPIGLAFFFMLGQNCEKKNQEAILANYNEGLQVV
jgi:hypothetical protein